MIQETPTTGGRAQKRLSVLKAAAEEFVKDGFDRASMDRISETAGVSKRTVYNHFPSKEALFTAMVDDMMSRCDAFKCEFDPDVDVETQLMTIGVKYADLAATEELISFMRVVTARVIQAHDVAASVFDQQEAVLASIVAWMKAAKKSGKLEMSDPRMVARQFSSLLDEFLLWPQLLQHTAPLSPRRRKQIVRSTVELILARYQPTEP